MKTNIFFHTAVVFAVLSCLFGCANPEVELRKGTEIQIRPSTVLSGFTPFASDNFEMYDDSHLRITCLLYDKTGNLAYQDQALLDNFNQDISFHTTLDENNGDYTIIALATCIMGTLSSPTLEAYSISGTGSLDQLCVKQEYDGNSYYSTWSVMGYASQTLSFDCTAVSLNLKPATSLVYMQWKDIHVHDRDVFPIDEYYIIYHPNNVLQFTHDGTPKYSSSLSASQNRGDYVNPAKNMSSTNIYAMHNIFPGSSVKLFARTFSGNDRADYSNQKFTLVSGHQYVFSWDCATFKVTPYEGILGTRALIDELKPTGGNSLPSFQHIDFSQKQLNN